MKKIDAELKMRKFSFLSGHSCLDKTHNTITYMSKIMHNFNYKG